MQLVYTTWVVGWAPAWWKTLHTLRVLELGITFNLSDRSSRFCDEGKVPRKFAPCTWRNEWDRWLLPSGAEGTTGQCLYMLCGATRRFFCSVASRANHARKNSRLLGTPCPDTHFTPSYLALLKPDWSCVNLFFSKNPP